MICAATTSYGLTYNATFFEYSYYHADLHLDRCSDEERYFSGRCDGSDALARPDSGDYFYAGSLFLQFEGLDSAPAAGLTQTWSGDDGFWDLVFFYDWFTGDKVNLTVTFDENQQIVEWAGGFWSLLPAEGIYISSKASSRAEFPGFSIYDAMEPWEFGVRYFSSRPGYWTLNSVEYACFDTGSGDAVDCFPAPTPIPLPASGWLLLGGVGGIFALRRRKYISFNPLSLLSRAQAAKS